MNISLCVHILENNVIEHFPQDSNTVPQKVFLLALIRVKEAETTRIRTKY